MVAVANDTCPKLVRGQLVPDVVIVPRQHGMRAVAQMGAQACPCGDGLANACPAGRGVSQCDDNSRSNELFDESQSPVGFGRQGDQTNETSGGLLQAAKLVPVRRPDVM